MTPGRAELHRRLRISGLLLASGLLVQVITIYWSHPLAFVIFLVLGGALVAVGTLFYLYSIVST